MGTKKFTVTNMEARLLILLPLCLAGYNRTENGSESTSLPYPTLKVQAQAQAKILSKLTRRLSISTVWDGPREMWRSFSVFSETRHSPSLGSQTTELSLQESSESSMRDSKVML